MVLMLRPRSGPSQWVAREEYRLTPSVQVVEVTDGFGNLCQRLVAPVGEARQELVVYRKQGGQLQRESVIPVRFVPMTGEAQRR